MRLVSPQPDPRPPRGRFPQDSLPGDEAPREDSSNPAAAEGAGSAARLNDSEREALLLNIDMSLRVHTRAQLFSWAQGALQSLIPHEVLVCGLQEGRQTSMRVDCFSTAPVDCARFGELFGLEPPQVAHRIGVLGQEVREVGPQRQVEDDQVDRGGQQRQGAGHHGPEMTRRPPDVRARRVESARERHPGR